MILNLTQHLATAEQIAAGVVDLPSSKRGALVAALTVDELPSIKEINDRCLAIVKIATDYGCDSADNGGPIITEVMIGGAPWMMARLEYALINETIYPVYAFSKRVSVESVKEDGTVVKTNVFKHVGFVEAISDAFKD